jgi:hypothetical protein
MQISFGKGQEQFWTNVFPSELVAKHADNIKKFGRVLNVIKKLEPLFAVMSVQAMLKLFRFPLVRELIYAFRLVLMTPYTT